MADKHVMISYNWGQKDRALLIAELLKKHGISIWMDVEGGIQQGDVNKCMASGVEKAYAIVCLVSEKYQHSKNCRRELSYADIQNLPIFPCKVEKGYDGKDWLGLLTAGLLYYDFRKDDKEVENTLVNAIKVINEENDVKMYSQDEQLEKQMEIFERDFRGRIYQKEGDWPVQYGFESFDNIWIDWSHYYYDRTCVRRDGSFMSSQEVKMKKFRDVQFIADRTFVGTIYWDDKDYWSYKSGENSFWKYYIRLSEDLSRVESGKLMYVDKNNEVIDYKYYGKRTFYYNAVDSSGVTTSGELSYILHKIIDSSEDREDADARVKNKMQADGLEKITIW